MQDRSSQQPVIDLHDVAKTYRGGVRALRGIAMRVMPGEVFGLLGPNGAGKSTLVKILMTIIRPSSCSGTMLGERVGARQPLTRVGYLPEHLQFPDYLNGGQALDYYAALARVPAADRRRRADELLELVGMSEWRSKKIRTYSKGMRQRMGLAQALMNDPDLVLLDEPTDGVDPVGRREIRDVLRRVRDQGKTVFLNSHLLAEVEMICDKVAILSQGEVVTQGTIDELTRASRRYEFDLATPLPGDARVAERLGSLDAAVESSQGRARIVVPSDDAAAVQPLIDALRQSGAVIESLKPVRQSLEDYFIEAVTESGQAATDAAAQKSRGDE